MAEGTEEGEFLESARANVATSPAPIPPEHVLTDPAINSAALRLSEAMEHAIDAFLQDAVEDVLSSAPVDDELDAVADISADRTARDDDDGDEQELDESDVVLDDDDQAAITPPREPTLIIADVAAMGGSSEIAGATPQPANPAPYVAAGETNAVSLDGVIADDALGEALSPPPVAPDEARTGTFVNELKRTMSAIEQRLFGASGGGPGDNGAYAAGYDVGGADIDLDAIAVGSTIPGVAFDGSRAIPLDDDAPEVDDPERGVRHTTAPRVILTSGIRGDLREDDVAMLIARLHREGFAGRVTFKRGEAQKTICFEEGRLVFATSNLPHDRMGDLLYREGKITREQHAKSREIVAETGRRMGEILVEMGFLKRRELLPAVRRHVEDIVYSLFAWDTGTYTIVAGGGAPDEKIRLATHPAALVLEGIRRKIGLDRLREKVGPPSAVVAPLKRDDIAQALAEGDLSHEERQAADLFDGRRTIADVVAAARIDELTVYQLAHGLVALGHARVLETTRGDSDSGRVPPGSSLAGAADVAIDRERVLAKHAHVLEADYFAVLGVRRDATSFEIRRAYEAARKDYAPEAFPTDIQREHGPELREIAQILDEAFRVLRDDRVRASYLQNLRE